MLCSAVGWHHVSLSSWAFSGMLQLKLQKNYMYWWNYILVQFWLCARSCGVECLLERPLSVFGCWLCRVTDTGLKLVRPLAGFLLTHHRIIFFTFNASNSMLLGYGHFQFRFSLQRLEFSPLFVQCVEKVHFCLEFSFPVSSIGLLTATGLQRSTLLPFTALKWLLPDFWRTCR